MAEGRAAVYSSRVRTLGDAVYDWSRFNSLPRAYEWIRGDLAASRVSASALVAATLRYGNKGTIRRIGLLLERQGALTPSTGLIPWNPGKPKRGTISRRWGVVVNEEA